MDSNAKFIATFELGRLAKWLRGLGYDVLYVENLERKNLFLESLRQGRIILTRNKRLGKSGGIRMVQIKSEVLDEQLKQLIKELELKADKAKLFTRCILCNGLLEGVAKEKVISKVPPYVYKTQDEFSYCKDCDKIYWKGTHYENAKNILVKLGPL